MRKSVLIALVLFTFAYIEPFAAASDLSCSPAAGSNCTYVGCHLCGLPGSLCKLAPVTEVTEAACAICDTVAERAYYGAEQAGSGTCVSTPAADLCVGCNWCINARYGCGGGGREFPPLCDPPKAHGPVEAIQTADGDLETDKARSAPRGWILQQENRQFLLMEYRGKSLFPTLASHDEGLYFVQHPVSGMGWLAPSRPGMSQAIGYVLSALSGDEARIARKNPEVALLPPLPRSTVLVSAGKWSVEWRAVPPLAPFYFPMGEYPRLMYRDRPATLQDLEAAGVQPKPVP
jgi:hypothetical protein